MYFKVTTRNFSFYLKKKKKKIFYFQEQFFILILFSRNNFFAVGLLLASVQILDFLTFHHLFGPWSVIIGRLMVDLGKFLVILSIFLFGFSMYISAIYNPVRPIYTEDGEGLIGSGYPPLGWLLSLFYL